MTGEDALLFLGVLVAVGAGAYTLGARRSDRTAPPAPGADRAASADDDEVVVSVGTTEDVDPKEWVEPAPEPATVAETVASTSPSETSETLTTEPPPHVTVPPKREVAIIPKLFDTDDDDVDVTKVGSLTAPSIGPFIQPPVILHDDFGEEEAIEQERSIAEPYFLVTATAQTDTGLRRKRNEDSLLVSQAANLFVVADGMGGYNGGEHASRLAVKTIEDAFTAREFEGEPHDDVPPDASELARAMQMANARIFEAAAAKPELDGMGTTLCCARFSPTKRRLHIGHVGDSRCYRLRDNVFTQLTSDHTMADLGLTGPESANLSRAVGIWSTVPIDVIVDAPKPSDVYLLCSDGLTKMLDDDRIAHILRTEEDAQASVDRLIFFANARGGKDNITVILIRVVSPAASAAASPTALQQV